MSCFRLYSIRNFRQYLFSHPLTKNTVTMKKALCELTFIIADLERCILKYPDLIMVNKDLIKLRLLKGLRADLSETLYSYRPELKRF